MKAKPEAIPEGSHVHLVANSQHLGSGVIDTWMPDGSAFWIWLDHGAGKRLVHESEAVDVLVSATDPHPLPTRLTDEQHPGPTNSEPDPAETPIQEPRAAVAYDEAPKDTEDHEANALLNNLLRRLDVVIADVRAATNAMPHSVVEARLREELTRAMPTVTFPAADIRGWAAGFSS